SCHSWFGFLPFDRCSRRDTRATARGRAFTHHAGCKGYAVRESRLPVRNARAAALNRNGAGDVGVQCELKRHVSDIALELEERAGGREARRTGRVESRKISFR